MREDVHPCKVHPHKERLVRLHLLVHKVHGGVGCLIVDRLHALDVQRPRILDLAVCKGMNNTAWVVHLQEDRIVLGPIRHLRLLLGVQVVQVAEEFVEAMICRQILVTVSQVVLAELPGCISKRLDCLRDRNIALLDSHRSTWNAYLGHSRSYRNLSSDKGRSPGCAAILSVVVGERHSVFADAVDVRSHHPH
jgi:hypothetical protein